MHSQQPPDRRLVASVARQGVALGQCLGEALRSLQIVEKDRIEEDTTERILQTFGEAVADTDWDTINSDGEVSAIAPTALLKGRLDHYNRVGQNWRIVVEDAKLKSRLPLESDRRKRDRTSLWEVDPKRQKEFAIGGKVQILAHDDL